MFTKWFRYTLIGIGLCFGLGQVQGQFLLKGRVMEENTNKGIPQASMLTTELYKGALTDEEGRFELSVSKLPAIITISHIAYETRQIQIDQPSDSLLIFLIPQINTLEEVVVSGKEVQSLSDPLAYLVTDFELSNSKLFRLENYGTFGAKRLVLLDKTGQRLDELFLKKIKRIEGVFKACTNEIYLQTATDYFLINHVNGLSLGKPIDRKIFDGTLRPCQGIEGDNVFYLYERHNDLQRIIKHFNSSTGQVEVLNVIGDLTQIDAFYSDLGLIKAGQGISNILTNNPVESKRIRHLQRDSDFYSRVLYKPKYPVFTFLRRKEYLVLNHPEGQLEVYEGNEIKRTTQLSYMERKSWLRQVHQDPVSEKIYTLFSTHRGFVIHQVDIHTGLTQAVKTIKVLPLLVSKLRIYNDEVFYIRENDISGRQKELVKQSLR